MTPVEVLPSFIDHTLLRGDATLNEIEKLCEEAIQYHFFSVCIHPSWIPLAKRTLSSSQVKVCTVVGFPLGANLSISKKDETKRCLDAGADEIDMVIHLGYLKSKDWNKVEEDIYSVVQIAAPSTVKVILETCLLNAEEKKKACEISKKAGAHYVKTSTGFSSGGATEDDVRLMRKTVGEKMGVKASGGIRDRQTALGMIAAGASRLGTSSSVAIVSGQVNSNAARY